MKKALALILTGALAVGTLVGCGSTASTSSETTASKAATSVTSKAAASTAASSKASATSTAQSKAASKAAASTDAGTATDLSVKANKEYKIEVVLKTLSSEYWGYVEAGCKAAATDIGVSVDVVGPPSETSYDEQMNEITTALGINTYDAIVISPLQSDMVATQIANTSIPVIALDTKIDSDKISTFVGTGNEAAAATGGKAAIEAAKAAGWTELKAIEISGVQGDNTATDRLNGFKKGVDEAGGEFLEDEVQYANAVADQAVTSMEAIMQNHPEGISVICCNNDDMAMAAARAASGNTAYAKTIFCGFNGDKSACEGILAGQMTMSVAQNPYDMGYMSIQAAVKILNGDTLPSFVDSGSAVITKDNAQKQIDTLNSYGVSTTSAS